MASGKPRQHVINDFKNISKFLEFIEIFIAREILGEGLPFSLGPYPDEGAPCGTI